jgi:hypothetical protein
LTQEEALMAAAQILNLTHRVDKKVTDVGNQVMGVGNQITGVGNQVAGVGNTLKDVDDKMDVVVRGMLRVEGSFTIQSTLIALCSLDGKDAKVALQQTSNNVDDVKCS